MYYIVYKDVDKLLLSVINFKWKVLNFSYCDFIVFFDFLKKFVKVRILLLNDNRIIMFLMEFVLFKNF